MALVFKLEFDLQTNRKEPNLIGPFDVDNDLRSKIREIFIPDFSLKNSFFSFLHAQSQLETIH